MPYWQTASAHFHPGLPRSSTDEHFVGGAQLGYIGEMNRAPIKPALMRWARARAGYGISDLTSKFPRLQAWENGTAQPTLRQVENFARATHTPVGYLFLSEPPKETVPIPDFRSRASSRRDHPSPNLLTHEVPSTSTKQIKVPNVCLGIGVNCMTTYEMLRTERARFVLAQSA